MEVDVREEVLGGCLGREEEHCLAVQIFILVDFQGGRGGSSGLDITRVLEGGGQKIMSRILLSGACMGIVEPSSSSKSGGSWGSSVRGGGTVQPGGNQKDLKNVCAIR